MIKNGQKHSKMVKTVNNSQNVKNGTKRSKMVLLKMIKTVIKKKSKKSQMVKTVKNCQKRSKTFLQSRLVYDSLSWIFKNKLWTKDIKIIGIILIEKM